MKAEITLTFAIASPLLAKWNDRFIEIKQDREVWDESMPWVNSCLRDLACESAQSEETLIHTFHAANPANQVRGRVSNTDLAQML